MVPRNGVKIKDQFAEYQRREHRGCPAILSPMDFKHSSASSVATAYGRHRKDNFTQRNSNIMCVCAFFGKISFVFLNNTKNNNKKQKAFRFSLTLFPHLQAGMCSTGSNSMCLYRFIASM